MNKELQKRLNIIEKEIEKEKKEWWEKILPRKGSLLRQLVDRELAKTEIKQETML